MGATKQRAGGGGAADPNAKTEYGTFKDDESEYTGSFLGNRKHGIGKERWFSDGSQFEGNYVLGRKNGDGIYRWADGSLYQGQFKDDVISGKGVYRGGKSVYQVR